MQEGRAVSEPTQRPHKDAQTVKDGVQDLLPTIRERAEETERLRVVPESSVKELEEVGFFKLLQPTRFGGLEADPVDFYTCVRDIASACGSTGWVSSVLGVHPWQIALFDDEAQQAVWGEDPDTRVSSSYAPMGKAAIAEGGFTLSGRWSFSSGCAHATWVLLGGLVFNDEGQVVDFRTFLVPRERYEIVDVWNVVGLAGTGSNDIVVEDVFIPETFTLSMAETGRCKGPGQAVNTGDLYKLQFHSLFTTTITTPIIGMARGAYEEHVTMQQNRVRASYGEKASLDPFAAVRVATASSDIDAAWALLMGNIREQQAHVARGEKIPITQRLRIRRDQVLGTQRAIDAIDLLFEASGGRALANGTPLQRAWRDAHAGRVHAANDPERALQMYGASEFGHKVDPGMY
jgi:3-hydroxy-9,10-secoandrosta-1,3,5(10)-triene-9,17-dione monooxygenase